MQLSSVKPVASMHKTPIIEFSSSEGEEEDWRKWWEDARQFINDGERLYLEVDIKNYSAGKLKKDFCAIVDHYKKILKDTNKERKDQKVDKFQVWDLYEKKRSFRKIATELGSNESTVRMAYYRVFEAITGKRYDPGMKACLTKEQLEKTCESCSERNCCTDLCPEVAAFVNQDTRNSLKELLIGNPMYYK